MSARSKRSLSLSDDLQLSAARALAERGWTRSAFAKTLNISRSTLTRFLKGKRVDRNIFITCCEALSLDWTVSEHIVDQSCTDSDSEDQESIDADALVVQVRHRVEPDIQNRCGSMRILDMEQPIEIGNIYTSVNILEKVLGRRRLDIAELVADCDIEEFDRFTLSQIRQRRVPGIEAVERYGQLMILGKPGAGKTTFMKRLAVLCNKGVFQAGRVPVFVTLKEFAEAKKHPDLSEYILSQWITSGVEKDVPIRELLKDGRVLVLLDGLDEVQETEHDRVLHSIERFTREFHRCQFVMTCRIAAREYTFQQFTEVEISDFNKEQINEFAKKWFVAKNDEKKGENFIQRLEDNKPIQELATNPLLLTLLCLVFGEAADFPQNRAELYKEGLDVLLKKWDAKRNIERDKIYRELSLKRKEDLLAQLAFSTFEQGDYFFKQRVVEQKIVDYIQNLPGAKEDEEALLLDSEAVLKSIEAQHGLLVERAKHIYSFSHLTFQEYFTAKQVTSPSAQMQIQLQALAIHVTEKRYREIFLLAVGILPQADELLLCMKRNIDQIVSEEDNIQQLLLTVHQKMPSVNIECQPAATRAFYFALDQALNRALSFDHAFDLARALALARDLDLDRALDFDLVLDRALDQALDRARAFTINGTLDLDNVLAGNISPTWQEEVERLKKQLPDLQRTDHFTNQFRQWWQQHGKTWAASFRETIIKHRDIGRDWQFTQEQQRKLQQYYDANKLLVDCLNSDCYVTKATRQYIEDALLLPMSEIEKIPAPYS